MNTKKYFYTYEEVDEGKNGDTMISEILNDPDLPKLQEVIIGSWGECWDDDCQTIIDGIIEHKEKFMHIESLFIGDMEYDECEVSWIIQGNYEELLKALPNLKALTIKGSTDLVLGKIHHEELESLDIICGGLPKTVLTSIKNAYLPNLRRLNLYIGSENYGFDGTVEDVVGILENKSFSKLQYLGLGDSEIQDEIVEGVMKAEWPSALKILDFSNGTLTDKGAQCLLDNRARLENIQMIDLTHNYLTHKMQEKLSQLNAKVIMADNQEPDVYDGEVYYYAMLTE